MTKDKYGDTDNVNIEKALTQNDISLGLIYVLTRNVETFPQDEKLGKTHTRVTYEISLRTNAMLENEKNIINFFTQREFDEWKKENGVNDDN